MALFKDIMVCTHHDHAQIQRNEMYVNMEHEVFTAARHANWRPSFTILHRGVGPDIVENDSDVCMKKLVVKFTYRELLLSQTSP